MLAFFLSFFLSFFLFFFFSFILPSSSYLAPPMGVEEKKERKKEERKADTYSPMLSYPIMLEIVCVYDK